MLSDSLGIRISIDRGGTFTDCVAEVPGHPDIVVKLLSVDPSNYEDAPTEGIRRILEIATRNTIPRGELLDIHHVESLRMGTTVATNALLERKGARSALLITKGFKDLLLIGNQARPKIFDLSASKPGVLYENVVEVEERVTLETYSEDPDPQPIVDSNELVQGITGEHIRVLSKPDMTVVKRDLEDLWEQGYRSIAVVLLHSYTFPEHEEMIGSLAVEMGFSVALSSKLQPMIKVVPRGQSATADAYLSPIIRGYLASISANFKGGLEGQNTRCEFMQSDGGLVDYRNFTGLKAILSGPAGGVVGYARTSWDDDERVPIIGFDMGGTSTDVSRYAGAYEHSFESLTAGVTIQSPQLDINTVAAGGGSMLFWRNGLFMVGPESASAHPGPACYRKGGPLTVTDANLFLGRLLPEQFPKIFGPNEDLPLDFDITVSKFKSLTARINIEQTASDRPILTAEEVALGFLRVADESMSRPIRALTEARGHDVTNHHLACFGGAGGQHACSVASVLNISRVIIHKYSSILSAYGMSLADIVHEVQRPAAMTFTKNSRDDVQAKLETLSQESTQELLSQGFKSEQISHEYYLNMRYQGSNTALMILKGDNWDFGKEFEKRHQLEFGSISPSKAILVDDFRVRATGVLAGNTTKSPYVQLQDVDHAIEPPRPQNTVDVYFGTSKGRTKTPVFLLDNLQKGVRIVGPAMLIDKTQTIVLVPDTIANILETCVVIDMKEKKTAATIMPKQQIAVDPVQLSILGNRFMSIAEQMGRTLQKTSVSTNIKERLDFSCALFSPDGGLVANAPHVPVHLGSMQFAVKYQHDYWKDNLVDGDVLVTNHPACGGTHLPDITIITPVFDGTAIVFYVASRGHHADIGGILPGSMPPTSTQLWQEGAAIEAEKIMSGGEFHEEKMTKLLLHDPAQYDGCSGTRCLADNLSDLKAQIAANIRGIQLIKALISEHGIAYVHRYMYAIQETAELAVRDLLKTTFKKFGGRKLQATEYMDNGTPISLSITIDSDNGEAVFDFEGTGSEIYGNVNAPIAITYSAIIYSLRCLIKSEIPLNQGCLTPIDIRIPPRSLLSPSKDAGVVGGNVLTSQRITDVVLKAFRACAASQGCTNNLTFGTGGKSESGVHIPGFGYYETIAGGSGAGPDWHGQSGVHTHMTNTQITDPEIFEKRYPCILREFSLRHDSAGQGLYNGGEGTVRDIEFRIPVQCSILSERRAFRPYGMEGGGEGGRGLNEWIRKDKNTGQDRIVNLGGKGTAPFGSGDRIVIRSPGGGGWGVKVDKKYDVRKTTVEVELGLEEQKL